MHEIGFLSNVLAIFLTVLLGLAIVSDVHRDLRRLVSGRNVALLGIVSWYCLESVMLPRHVSESFSQGQYNGGLLCVGVAALCFLLGYHGTRGFQGFRGLARQVSYLEDRRALWTVVVVGA